MKKIFIIILLMVSFVIFADGLNDAAQSLKDKHPTVYAPIHERALRVYGDNYVMVLFEINRQSIAFYKAINNGLKDEPLFLSIYVQWVDDINLYHADKTKLLEIPCDWSMVDFEMERQMEARALLK